MTGDYCTKDGAVRLKGMIEAYWAERGHKVEIQFHKGGFSQGMRSGRTDVRSNMINGAPPGCTEQTSG